jgi:hypothetical protein
MQRAQNEKVQNQLLKVQSIAIRTADTHLYEVDSGDVIVQIGQEVAAVVSCIVVDNSVPGVVVLPAASLSIVDSTAFTAGGDELAIKLDTLTLAANDIVLLQYIAK